jgi:SCY1-like protein 2
MISEIYQSELELKMHINEILNALSFFHNDAKISHLGICPENIYITNDGKWKLGGMIFSYQLLNN